MRLRTLIPHAPRMAFAAATLGFGAGNVLTKVILDRGVNALELLPIRFLFAVTAAATVVLIAALASGSIEGISRMDPGSWGLIALVGTAATTLPFGALLWLSELTTAARVSLMAYLVPLVGVAGGVLILDEPFGWRLVGGGAFILAGVVLADRSERRAHALATAPTP